MQHSNSSEKSRFTIIDLTQMGMMIAVIEAAKRALEFVPNVELVTLLFIVFALYFGKRVIIVSFAFTFLETFVWGLHTWVIMYLYIWPLLIILVLISRKHASYWFYCFLSALFGLFFGAMCSIPYLFIGGPVMMFNWWIAGIPYDVLHCISNFLLCLVLFKPLSKTLEKITKKKIVE
ncbi:MAG: hypothetical protein E7309_04405 [Butyrivibrio sp.]|nr:hypothetical protein [Butyrivibrio sp.]